MAVTTAMAVLDSGPRDRELQYHPAIPTDPWRRQVAICKTVLSVFSPQRLHFEQCVSGASGEAKLQ